MTGASGATPGVAEAASIIDVGACPERLLATNELASFSGTHANTCRTFANVVLTRDCEALFTEYPKAFHNVMVADQLNSNDMKTAVHFH